MSHGSRRLHLNGRAGACVLVLAVLAGLSARPTASPDSRPVVRFLLGSPGGFNQHGFVAEYAKALPRIALTIMESTRQGGGRLEELQAGDADMTINLAHAAYLAYSGQLDSTPQRFDRLRAISALGVVPVHLVARAGSGIRHVTDLRGRSLSVGVQNGEVHRLTRSILGAYGVDMAGIQTALGIPSEKAATLVGTGKLDALVVVGGYPAEAVRTAMASGAYLVPMEGPPAERLRLSSRFFKVALVPSGVYPGQTTSVRTVGLHNILLVRRDIDEQVVYELTKQFFTVLPKLSPLVSSLQAMDIDQASATSIPLHDGAARYYRERELFR